MNGITAARRKSKRKIAELLGFNDRALLLIGIPTVAFIVPFVFFAESWSSLSDGYAIAYLSSLFFTLIYWLGNRQILLAVRRRFQRQKDDLNRILVQSALVLVYTLGVGVLAEQSMSLLPALHPTDDSPLLAGLFITFFILTIYELVWSTTRLKQAKVEAEQLKRANLQTQLDLLKTQVNPHFLFNSLNTLAYLIPDQPDHAVRFVQNLSVVYRSILEMKEKELVSLEEEVTWLKSYIYLLEARFGESLQVEIDLLERYQSRYIVPLALQLLLENAIKHNIVASRKPLYVSISIRDEGEPFVQVKNALQLKNHQEPSTGLGLENIAKRYALLSERALIIEKSDAYFTVALPLLNIPQHEDRYH